jgi:hypothetical protein
LEDNPHNSSKRDDNSISIQISMKPQTKRSLYDDMNCTYQGRELKFPPNFLRDRWNWNRAAEDLRFYGLAWISGLKEKIPGQVVSRYVCEIFLAKKL